MTLVLNPVYPIAGDAVTISFLAPLGNTVQAELTSVPPKSALVIGPLLNKSGEPTDQFTPDVPGVYGITAHDYLVRSRAASYSGDPAGGSINRYQTTELGTVYVGVVEELPIVTTLGHGATLRLTISNATVRAADLASPLSDVSRKALLDTAVIAALAALVSLPVSGLDADFATDVQALRLAYENHRVQTGGGSPIHTVADTTNVSRRERPTSIAAAIDVLNDLWQVIGNHQTQGPGGGTYHVNDDGVNNLVTAQAKTLGQATVMKADLRGRVYSRHRVQVGATTQQVHGSADNTALSVMPAPLPLPVLIVALLDTIVATSATAPTGEQDGAMDVEHKLGFTPR